MATERRLWGTAGGAGGGAAGAAGGGKRKGGAAGGAGKKKASVPSLGSVAPLPARSFSFFCSG